MLRRGFHCATPSARAGSRWLMAGPSFWTKVAELRWNSKANSCGAAGGKLRTGRPLQDPEGGCSRRGCYQFAIWRGRSAPAFSAGLVLSTDVFPCSVPPCVNDRGIPLLAAAFCAPVQPAHGRKVLPLPRSERRLCSLTRGRQCPGIKECDLRTRCSRPLEGRLNLSRALPDLDPEKSPAPVTPAAATDTPPIRTLQELEDVGARTCRRALEATQWRVCWRTRSRGRARHESSTLTIPYRRRSGGSGE